MIGLPSARLRHDPNVNQIVGGQINHVIGMWLHLAVVIDGKARKVVHYVNGSPISRHVLNIGPPFRVGSAELGNWNARSGPNPAPALIRNLSGALDEFELFSRTLSDEEIHELYIIGKPDE